MEIAIDFDGTVVEHRYPRIGNDIGAIPVLRRLVKNGHRLLLFTMRSGEELLDAVKWFDENKIPLFGINTNPTQKNWTKSPKCLADLYIDDAGIGTPLITPSNDRPYVDWKEIEKILIEKKIL